MKFDKSDCKELTPTADQGTGISCSFLDIKLFSSMVIMARFEINTTVPIAIGCSIDNPLGSGNNYSDLTKARVENSPKKV